MSTEKLNLPRVISHCGLSANCKKCLINTSAHEEDTIAFCTKYKERTNEFDPACNSRSRSKLAARSKPPARHHRTRGNISMIRSNVLPLVGLFAEMALETRHQVVGGIYLYPKALFFLGRYTMLWQLASCQSLYLSFDGMIWNL